MVVGCYCDCCDGGCSFVVIVIVYLTQKYKDHESAVDCLLGHILSALGFNDGRLFSFPQLRSPLKYGEENKVCNS